MCTKLEIYVFIFEKQIMTQENTAPKTKNRAIQTPVKQGDELMCSVRVSNSYSTSGTCRVVTKVFLLSATECTTI
jgi:hypothetical protein